uniref:Uncharacterized protein MANES_07G103100 n=1 Tax=Rhizophora mucronata TaxID=61149 RepID=A0A2P2LUH7_RHIMU
MEVAGFKRCVDEISQKVDNLEQRVNEVEQFYLNKSRKQPIGSKAGSVLKDKDKGRHVPRIKKQQELVSCSEAAAEKRMQELIRQFGAILHQAVSDFLVSSFVIACYLFLAYTFNFFFFISHHIICSLTSDHKA